MRRQLWKKYSFVAGIVLFVPRRGSLKVCEKIKDEVGSLLKSTNKKDLAHGGLPTSKLCCSTNLKEKKSGKRELREHDLH